MCDMKNSTEIPKICHHNLTNRDLPFVTVQFTSLAFIMHEIYNFSKFEIMFHRRINYKLAGDSCKLCNNYYKG